MANIAIILNMAGVTIADFNAINDKLPFPWEMKQTEGGIEFTSQRMEWICKNLYYAGKDHGIMVITNS